MQYKSTFIGRKAELKLLNDVYHKMSASLIVVKGRRRIGKSRLIQEFAKDKKFYQFTGLPPTEHTTDVSERYAFLKQLKKNLNITTPIKHEDWLDLFWCLANHTKLGKVVILFDEISWMGSKDPDFLGKLKTVWDNNFKQNSKLVLVLCGSISPWIEKNILASTGFVGRISLNLTLNELTLADCNHFWHNQKQNISAFEKFKLLAITGGIPRYLEEIKPNLPAEENIKQMCFEPSGILFHEFEQIFSDLFAKRSNIYRNIITYLVNKKATIIEIANALKLPTNGVLTKYLEDLILAGFITRHFAWRLQQDKSAKLSYFRLSDNYLRFYLKYILPNKPKIENNLFRDASLSSLPGINTILGLQFENLVLKNHNHIYQLLNIYPGDIVASGPYFQRTTARQPGCQIDYLIQTKFNCLYLCEIKFSKYLIKIDTVKEVTQKIKNLKIPKHFSVRPVLIHVNGVDEEVEDEQFFADLIGFWELLG